MMLGGIDGRTMVCATIGDNSPCRVYLKRGSLARNHHSTYPVKGGANLASTAQPRIMHGVYDRKSLSVIVRKHALSSS
jgi:hypothetical protein